jgi:hypothetical protein
MIKRIVLLSFFVAGCSKPTVAYPFDSRGLAPPQGGYRVDFEDAASYRFLSADWRIDNFVLDDDERPRARETATLDLSLHHRRTHAQIWVDSAVIDRSVEQTELRVLAENWVASIADHGYFDATFVGGAGVEITSRRYAAEILDARAVGIGGQPGYSVLVDVANLNQAEIRPEERAARALVTFVRLPHPRRIRSGNAIAEEPMLMVIGYVNVPQEFDENMADFTRFVESIEFVPDEP